MSDKKVFLWAVIGAFILSFYFFWVKKEPESGSIFEQIAEEGEQQRGSQRYRLISRDPLLIEDTYSHTLYTEFTNKGAILKALVLYPEGEWKYGPFLTGNISTIISMTEAREERLEEQRKVEVEEEERWEIFRKSFPDGKFPEGTTAFDLIEWEAEQQIVEKDPQKHWDIFDTIDLKTKETSKSPAQGEE